MHGLKGLHAFIIMTEDLDNLIANFVRKQNEKTQTKLLPIFLDNMQYPEEENKDNNSNNKSESSNNEQDDELSITKLGSKCLKDMAARANHITVRPLCESLLEYLDRKNLWVPNLFAIEALKSLSIGVLPQLYSTIIRFLLEHLDRKPVENIAVRTSIVQCVQQILPNSITQQMPEVLSSMIRQISLPGDNNKALADAAVSCIATASEKQTDLINQLEAMHEILSHIYSSGISNSSKISLCNAVLQITEKLKPLSRDKNYPPNVMERLCVALLDKNADIRQNLLICLLRILNQTDLLKRMKETSKSTTFLQQQYEIFLSQIHSSLLSQSKRKNNKPNHFRLIFEVHEKLLEGLQYKGVVALLPNLFHLQEIKDSNLKKNLYSIHALILVLLAKVAVTTKNSQLSQYVSEIASKRKEANEIPISLSVDLENSCLYVTGKKEPKSSSKDISVNILFDKEQIIDLLTQSNELSSTYDLPSLLDKDVSRSVTAATGEMEAKIEERRKRKENAMGVSSATVSSVPLISAPAWTFEAFESIFCKFIYFLFFKL